ncbi:MAG: DegV family protein [Coprococcus sp.]|nr:DegV family protein [Coprococcus sp.]
MSKIAVITDSNSGITQAGAKELGIRVLPMPFYINDELFFEDITLSQEEFYQRLSEDANITTSQPAPADVTGLWDEMLKEYDEIVHIPMSSGLSSSCETAIMLASDYEGRVQVVNNQRISVTQRRSVLEAIRMAKAGRSARKIKELLEATRFDSDIYITVDTLKYLKKGGRLTPAAAAVGTVLNLKPILRIKGEKLDAFAKTRGWKSAKRTMLKTVEEVIGKDFEDCDGPTDLYIDAAYTGSREEALDWKAELEEAFPGYDIHMDPLSLSVTCHIGPGARAVTVTKKLHIDE